MNTYHLNGSNYLVLDGRLYVEVAPIVSGTSRDEKTTSALKETLQRTHAAKRLTTTEMATVRGTTVRKCGNCGEPGHQACKCPQGLEHKLGPEPTNTGACVICKSVEHETKDCEDLGEEITRLREEGLDSLRIAAKLKIRLATINESWLSQTKKHDI